MPKKTNNNKPFSINQIKEPKNIKDVIYNLMADPNLAPVNYFNDFSEKGCEMENLASDDTDETGAFSTDDGQIMAMTTHAYHHHLEEDPKTATEILISRAARRMVCFGAKPIVVSAFLYHISVANPNGQTIAAESKKGLENACKNFGLKVSDRKIRFDYASDYGPIPPTLIISMMGSVKNKDKIITRNLKTKGNNIFVIGKSHEDINSSEYLDFYHEIPNSPLPVFDIKTEALIQQVLPHLIDENIITSASPVGKGGLFFSLMRAGMPSELGFDITTDAEIRIDSFLFGESMGRIIVGVPEKNIDKFIDVMKESKLPFFILGHTTKGEIRIDDESFGFIDKMISEK